MILEQFHVYFLPTFFFISGFAIPVISLVLCFALVDKLSGRNEKDSDNE